MKLTNLINDPAISVKEILLAHEQTFKPGLVSRIYSKGRTFSGFVLPLEGQAEFETVGTGSFTLGAGELLYLPARSRYVIRAGSAPFRHYTVNFLLSETGEKAIAAAFSNVKETDVPRKIVPESAEPFRSLIRQTVNAYQIGKYGYGLFCKARVTELIYCFLAEKERQRTASGEYEPIKRALAYIDDHFCETITTAHLATLCSTSETSLRRKFRAYTGQPPLDYQTDLRIRRAKELLLLRELSIGEVAREVGFSDANYFSRLFRRRTGMSPMAYAGLYSP